MSSPSPIGGYFELELRKGAFLYPDAILLNSGRSAFEYVLKANKVKRVHMPKFTCDVMLEPLESLGVPHTFYAINDKLEIADPIVLEEGEMLLYTNYFGLKDDYSLALSGEYHDQLILDCSQALYFKPLAEGHTVYSPRKFFGLPDGGALVTPHKIADDLPIGQSYQRVSHLLKRIDLSAEDGYSDFKDNDRSLSGEPVTQMSGLTRSLVGNIDFEAAKSVRESNFEYLHSRLGARNKIQIDLERPVGPMVYPFLSGHSGLRQRLIDNAVYVATYWPNVLGWCTPDEVEYKLAKHVIPLPIDQRYDKPEMERLIDLLDERND